MRVRIASRCAASGALELLGYKQFTRKLDRYGCGPTACRSVPETGNKAENNTAVFEGSFDW